MPSEHRLHPTSILFALGGSLRSFAVPAILLLFTTSRSSPDASNSGNWGPAAWMNRWMPGDLEIANWQFWLLLFLIPALVVALARYFSFRLRYEGTELVIRSGIVFRNERHVPYARIQNLDAVRNVAHRLFGVAEIRVETGGGQTPEATISVLHETVFEEMRRRIFEGRALATAASVDQPDATTAPVPAAESRTLLHLPVAELLLNGLLDNRGMVLIATGAGVLWEAGLLGVVSDRLASGLYRPGLVRETARDLATGDILGFLTQVTLLAVGIIAVLAFVRILSMIWSVVRLHDFRLSRVGDDVRTEYGLLTRVTTTIPLRRLQALTIQETPLQRLLERMSVRAETAGGQAKPQDGSAPKQPRERLAPIIRREAMPALLNEVLPGFELSELDWQPLHPRAFRRALKPPVIVVTGIAAVLTVSLGWPVLLLLPFAIAWTLFAMAKYVAHTHWAATEDFIVFRHGWLWRQVVVVPVAKIQAIGRIESPFDRRAVMATVRVDTAGSGPSPAHRIHIPYLARETAAALYDRLATQTAQTAFRW
jgi:putative membrane protein